MARKQLLLDLLRKGHFAENLFIDSLSQEEKERAGAVDEWAPKDVIAHIAYWKSVRTADFQRVVDGGSAATIEDFDHENAKIFKRFSSQSWSEILAFAEGSTAALLSEIEKLSESDLELEWRDGQPIWRIAFTNGYSHPIIHIADHYHKNGDMQRAAEVTGLLGEPTLALDDSADWQGLVLYNVACSYALLDRKEEAIKQLAQALAIRPNLVEWSQQDGDLDSLRGEPAFQALYQNKT